jgi:hypothetical protein|nr:MAG TPA: Nucleotide modification associated domain 1 [Caudoviricetes sp.]
MANTKEKLQTLKTLHSQQQALYAEKNEKYDDAFAKTYAEYGPTVAIIRLEDKLNRVKALVAAGLDDSNGESLVDTLTDMANYANMFLIELGAKAPTVEEKPKKKRNRKNKGEPETAEKGPLDDLTKKQLVELISQLGGTASKKDNRKKLMGIIEGFPKAKVAVAITSLKAQSEPVEDEDDGEEGE